MSVNKYLPHLFVLPEDDADRQLAIGFQLNTDKIRQIKVLEEAGGWGEVLKLFESVHIAEMERNQNRFMVLLIDFDGRPDRLNTARAVIPNHLAERVFVLGSLIDPQALLAAFRHDNVNCYEDIGSALARDCRDGTDMNGGHNLLRHNAGELDRLREHIRPILF